MIKIIKEINRIFRKIRIFIFIVLCKTILIFTKKNPKIWIIHHEDLFFCNTKYFLLWMKYYKAKDIRIINLTHNKNLVKKLRENNYETYRTLSLKGIFYILRAKVWIDRDSTVDLQFLRKGMIDVYLWHGVGLKTIEANLKVIIYKQKSVRMYKKMNAEGKIRLIVCPSSFMMKHFKDAFLLKDKYCIKAGYPRLEHYVNRDFRNRIEKEFSMDLRKDIEIEKKKRIIMYAPTFRDSKDSFLKIALPNLDLLNKTLENTNSVLILKLHKNIITRNESIESLENEYNKDKYKNIILWDNEEDIYQYWNDIDVLIADYSSIVYDYIAIGGKQVIMYPFDYNDYITKSRALIANYWKNTPSFVCKNFDELINAIMLNRIPINQNRLDYLNNLFWEYGLENSCKRVYDAIIKIIPLQKS